MGACQMEEVRARVSEGGRVSLPAAYRRALGVNIGDDVILRLEEGEVRIFTLRHAIENAQALVRQYLGEGRSLSEELLAERREAAAHE